MIPSGYKNGKVYSVKPTDGTGDLTFTRASSATRVASNGLIERVRTNLLLNSVWANSGGTPTSWADGFSTGTLTSVTSIKNPSVNALRFVCSTQRREIIQTFTVNSGTILCFSSYVENATTPIEVRQMLRVGAVTGLGTTLFFKNNVAISDTTLVEADFTYTCQFTCTITGSFQFRIGAGVLSNVIGDITISMPQYEVGDIATDYIPTTTAAVSVGPVANLPRLNYPINSDGSVGCPSLLLEPQRTNLVTFSEQFDNATWTKLQTSLTANSIVSPDGFTNADTLTANGTSNEHQLRSTGVVTLTSGTTYTTSIFAKAGTNNFVQLIGSGSTYSATTYANFNIATGVLGDVGAGTTASIVAYGNGWYRCSMTAAANATSSTNTFLCSIVTSNTAIRGESNTLSTNVYLYGAQLESGAYATSYIPTLGSTVTRLADACSKTGISSLIGQTQGTLFLDIKYLSTGSTASSRWFKVFGTSNEIALAINGLDFIRSIVNNQSDTITTSPKSNTGIKIAWAYSASGVVLFVNGVEHALPNGSSQVISSLDSILFDASANTNFAEGNIYQALLFKTRLSNNALASLTTL